MSQIATKAAQKAPDGESAGFDALSAYRRMFATAKDGLAAWWYFGTTFAKIGDYPTIPVIQAETLMIYKTKTLSADAFRIDWWEIGYLRDPVTGEIADTWTNPITGEVVASPKKFEEGPAHVIIERAGNGLSLKLVQAHARIESVTVDFSFHQNRVLLTQTERKVRGYPLPDGSMPSLDSENVSPACTTLSIFSNLADLKNDNAASTGSYEFTLSSPPPWMGFKDKSGLAVTQGIMTKSAMNDRLNPAAWSRLQALFPDCFNGADVSPRWP